MEFHCAPCEYTTAHRGHYLKHLQSTKHKKVIIASSQCHHNFMKSEDSYHTFPESNHFSCRYCNRYFSSRQSRHRHETKFCKQNEIVPYEKLADLMNLKDKELGVKDKKILEHSEKIDKLERKIDSLMQQLQMTGINNHGVQNIANGNQTNNTIQLLNYNQTDYEFLTHRDFIRCFQDNNHCVKALIEKVHFNKKKPENMNIYVSCLKGKYVMVYRDNKWQIRDRKAQIDDLYDANELVLDNWFDEYSEKYPHIIQSFQRYLKNKDEDDTIVKKVKDELLLMLYNKRDMVEETRSLVSTT
jgi:hypothetical protein